VMNSKSKPTERDGRISGIWVTAQMPLVDTKMAKVQEVFLPYMANRKGQQSHFGPSASSTLRSGAA